MDFEYTTNPPSAEQYFALFETTGWNRIYRASAEELILVVKNSQFVVCAYEGQKLVGFGRVLTDGVLHAMIYDMIVHPYYQRLGIGTQILNRLIAWCKENKIRDIQLFCARGKRGFYEHNGFFARPDEAPGMQYK